MYLLRYLFGQCKTRHGARARKSQILQSDRKYGVRLAIHSCRSEINIDRGPGSPEILQTYLKRMCSVVKRACLPATAQCEVAKPNNERSIELGEELLRLDAEAHVEIPRCASSQTQAQFNGNSALNEEERNDSLRRRLSEGLA